MYLDGKTKLELGFYEMAYIFNYIKVSDEIAAFSLKTSSLGPRTKQSKPVISPRLDSIFQRVALFYYRKDDFAS